MSKISTIKRICSNCLHYAEISSVTDIFPNDKKKCTKFKNAVFRHPELSPEKDYTYHTVFTARYDKTLCGSEGKYFTPKYL
jgi:hypothetical protein